jgi:hypothetical protein
VIGRLVTVPERGDDTASGATGALEWVDRDAGPIVRPYAMTSGRTTPTRGGFDLISIVLAARPGRAADGATYGTESAEIIRCCQQPVSVAEISAHLDLPARTVKVLLGDLLDQNLIHTRRPGATVGLPDELVLEAVMHGLRSLH